MQSNRSRGRSEPSFDGMEKGSRQERKGRKDALPDPDRPASMDPGEGGSGPVPDFFALLLTFVDIALHIEGVFAPFGLFA